MKVFLIHEKDKPSENYCPVVAGNDQDAEMYFIGEYCYAPADMNYTLVEYAPVKSCVWTEDSDGVWETECGDEWQFTDGGVTDNNCTYCHKCGGVVAPVAYVVPGEGD